MKEIAVIGGTFDPVTVAHEAIMQACLDAPYIDEVWVMPSGKRADKPQMLENAARLMMLELVKSERFQSDPRLVVTDFEQRLPQPTETYRTVEALQGAYPDKRFWFVFGADSYQQMPQWRQGKALRQSLGMLLVPRAGYALSPESDHIRHLPVTLPPQPVSASQVRTAYACGQPVTGFTSPAVTRYIRDNRLYSSESLSDRL